MRIPIDLLIRKYQHDVFRAAFSVCRQTEDAEDVMQDTFIKYYQSEREFESEEHVKAWLLRTAINGAKDVAKSFFRSHKTALEEYTASVPFESTEDKELFLSVMSLPEKLRIVIHLFYYEDLSAKEIASVLRISEGSVKMRLKRAREKMKGYLMEDFRK